MTSLCASCRRAFVGGAGPGLRTFNSTAASHPARRLKQAARTGGAACLDAPSPLEQATDALYRFTRPHTMIGTALSVSSVSLMAMRDQAWGKGPLLGIGLALAAALLANVCIVGINQCCDIAIDRVNKPYLPLASGEWTPATGWSISTVAGALALAVAALSQSVPLFATVAGSIVLGIVYSVQLPFLRWKRSPVAAAACIISVRSILVQMGFWAHVRHWVGAHSWRPSNSLVFMTAFMVFFSIVIALFKDIPDVRGDEMHETHTASVRFGTRRIYSACIYMMYAAYAAALCFIAAVTGGAARGAVLVAQGVMPWLLHRRSQQTDLSSHSSIVAMYMFVWKLFYAQYLLFPFIA